MIALRVTINEEPPITAGAEDLGVLNAIVGCGGILGSTTYPYGEKETRMLDCQVSGLTRRPPSIANEHLRWLQRWDLKVGDRVTVEIVEVNSADIIIESVPANGTIPRSAGNGHDVAG